MAAPNSHLGKADEGAHLYENVQLGDVGAGTVQHDLSHKTEKWYCGPLPKDACNSAVCSGDPGDFLVRDSSDGKKMVIVINDHGSPANYQVCGAHA